ncbi:MAG: hypothetical protein NVS4B12_03760 [Ktedonobacteraceae bacterium]
MYKKRQHGEEHNIMTLSKDHYLVSRQGTFDTSGSPHATTQADLDHLFATLATDKNRDRLVLHFHGGLVDFVSGMQNAEDITKRYADLQAYQVFFLWQTALFDVLSEKTFLDAICPNISQAFNDPFFQQVLLYVTQFVKGKVDATNGGAVDRWLDLPDKQEVLQELHNPKDGQEPYSDIESTALPEDARLHKHEEKLFRDHLMQNDTTLKQHAQNLVATHAPAMLKGKSTASTSTITPTPPPFSLAFIAHFLTAIRDTVVKGIEEVANLFIVGQCVAVLKRVIDRFAQRRDHGLYPTIVEEILRQFFVGKIGKEVWGGIKKEASDTFGVSDTCVGTAFLRGLKTYCDNNPNAHITLVGHSAGGIYICELLQHAHAILPSNVTFDVVLLAPANSYKLFSDTLKTYQSRIQAVRVFAMSDELEQKDALIPGVYPLSLLYLVSGILEQEADTPILGMQRYFTDKVPYTIPEVQETFAYLNKYQTSHVWSLTMAGDGLSSNSKSHATFYSEEITMNSVKYVIANGLRY